jgi:hypothetical protein
MPSIFSVDAINNPQIDSTISTGMRILDIPAENTEQDLILNWFVKKHPEYTKEKLTCRTYDRENEFWQYSLACNDHEWRYFMFDEFILDHWKYGSKDDLTEDTFIVYKTNTGYVKLDDYALPWNQETFFKTHHELFYIITICSTLM